MVVVVVVAEEVEVAGVELVVAVAGWVVGGVVGVGRGRDGGRMTRVPTAAAIAKSARLHVLQSPQLQRVDDVCRKLCCCRCCVIRCVRRIAGRPTILSE